MINERQQDPMDILIHKRDNKALLSSVEIRTAGERIILLPGKNAISRLKKAADPHSSIREGEPDAVLLGRFDPEEYKALRLTFPGVPLYMSKEIMMMAEVEELFSPSVPRMPAPTVVKPGRSFKAGQAAITPQASPGGPTKFLIETPEGNVLFDPRDSVWTRDPGSIPTGIDIIVTGTTKDTAHKEAPGGNVILFREIKEALSRKDNITLLFASPYDIGAIIKSYKAAQAERALFVIDLKSALIFERLKKLINGLPSSDSKGVRIRFDGGSVEKLEKRGYRSLLFFLGKKKIDIFGINRERGKILLIADVDSATSDILRKIDGIKGAKAIIPMKGSAPDAGILDLCKKRGLDPVTLELT